MTKIYILQFKFDSIVINIYVKRCISAGLRTADLNTDISTVNSCRQIYSPVTVCHAVEYQTSCRMPCPVKTVIELRAIVLPYPRINFLLTSLLPSVFLELSGICN